MEKSVIYKFFNEIYNFENKINKLFTPDYSLEIKLSNYDDNIFVTVKTNKMPKIQDLPQSISELINKYDILRVMQKEFFVRNCEPETGRINGDTNLFIENKIRSL